MQPILLDPQNVRHPTRDAPPGAIAPDLPSPQGVVTHPSKPGGENASLFFVGTATTIIEWAGIRIMTDPNFLHAGDHVHLGPGVSSMRRTNPALGLHELPRIDLVLLSHYHGWVDDDNLNPFKNFGSADHTRDHFDQVVEASLRRDLPIITTPHAKSHLTRKGADSFTDVSALDPFESQMIHIKNTLGPRPSRLRVTGMPGKHVPESSVVEYLNATAHAIPPTNGWMLELGTEGSNEDETGFVCGYRIYITGDTLLVDDLKHIAQRYAGERINLMLAHLGGTTIPSPSLAPLALLVTMDAEQGVRLIQLIQPDLTIPIHYDDYDVFASSLAEFKTEVERAGLENKVVYLDRKDRFDFAVRVHPNKEKVY